MLSDQYDGSHTVLTSVELPPAVQFLDCAISGRGSAPRTLAWQGPVGNLGPADAMARRQQARALELHVALSLSRLWQQQGKQAAAQALLTPIYGWCTEGCDSADLQEAKALLEA